MKTQAALALMTIFLITGCATQQEKPEEEQMAELKLTSPAFQDNGKIPDRYTCKGDGTSPELDIGGIPEGTESLTLIIDDPDAPGKVWDHWVLFNIQPTEKIQADSAPGTQGKNSWGKSEYGGPCPPSGTHRYVFKLYALDTALDLDESADKAAVEKAMKGHILAQAKLTGLYSK